MATHHDTVADRVVYWDLSPHCRDCIVQSVKLLLLLQATTTTLMFCCCYYYYYCYCCCYCYKLDRVDKRQGGRVDTTSSSSTEYCGENSLNIHVDVERTVTVESTP